MREKPGEEKQKAKEEGRQKKKHDLGWTLQSVEGEE